MSNSNLLNAGSEAPAVDFMALLGRCLGNFKIVERVIAAFRDSGRSDLDQLQKAVDNADFAAVAEISHRLKGAASNVAATGLANLLVQAEQSGRDQEHVELRRIMAELQAEWISFSSFAQVFAPTTNVSKHNSLMQTQVNSEARHACAGC